MNLKCFACNRPMNRRAPYMVTTGDGQKVWVGPDCYKAVCRAHDGYQPPIGGPKLYPCDCEAPKPVNGLALISNECALHG